MEQPKLINNISERVVDDFKQRLSKGACVSIAAASFSIYAYEALKEELEQVEQLRFIFTSPTFIKDKSKKKRNEFFILNLTESAICMVRTLKLSSRNQLPLESHLPKNVPTGFAGKCSSVLGCFSQEQMGGLYARQQWNLNRFYLRSMSFAPHTIGLRTWC